MKSFIIILLFLIFSKSAFSNSENTLVVDEHIDNKWIISTVTNNSIHASVNGKVTHGDHLHVRFVKGHCEIGNLITFVYSYSKNRDLKNLKDKYVKTKFMGQEVTGKILFTLPFLMGHRSTVDFGWMTKNDLKRYLTKGNEISIIYLDSVETKITEYFDVTSNHWVNTGLDNAIEKASNMCKKL